MLRTEKEEKKLNRRPTNLRTEYKNVIDCCERC